MRFDIYDGARSVGTVLWEGPGQVRLEVDDRRDREFLSEYFTTEVTYLTAGFDEDGDGTHSRRRDWSPWEFQRACRSLPGYQMVAQPAGPVEEREGA